MKINGLRGIVAAFLAMALVQCVPAQLPQETEVWEPEPVAVRPGTSGEAPADAIVLLGSGGADEWRHTDGGEVEWLMEGGVLTVAAGTGNIETVRSFGDVQLHLEWRAPARIEGEGQGRGNSGVFLQKRYEVQILDSYDNRTYSNGQAASVYKQHIPLVNAMKPPGEWQSYDIVLHRTAICAGWRARKPGLRHRAAQRGAGAKPCGTAGQDGFHGAARLRRASPQAAADAPKTTATQSASATSGFEIWRKDEVESGNESG